jgi:nucleoid DNA-binding protein
MAGQKLTKSQFVASVAEKSGLNKKQAATVLDAINAVIVDELKKKEPAEVTIPGLLKLTVVKKKAVEPHEGINPFTKKVQMFKGKPASRTVRARPVKALKDAL